MTNINGHIGEQVGDDYDLLIGEKDVVWDATAPELLFETECTNRLEDKLKLNEVKEPLDCDKDSLQPCKHFIVESTRAEFKVLPEHHYSLISNTE